MTSSRNALFSNVLKKADAKASAGPWRASRNRHGDGYVTKVADPHFLYLLECDELNDEASPIQDASLIVLLRNAVPEIVAVLEALDDWRRHPAGEWNQPEVTKKMLALFDAADALDAKVRVD